MISPPIILQAANFETQRTSRYRWNNRTRKEKTQILQLTLSGHGTLRFKGEEYRVGASRAMIMTTPEDSEYFFSPECTEPWSFCWLSLTGVMEFWNAMQTSHGCIISISNDSVLHRNLLTLCDDVRKGRMDDPWRRSGETYRFLMQLASDLESSLPVLDPLEAIQHRMEVSLRQRQSIKEYASASGMSREHFSRLFKARFGIGPGAYSRLARLREARQLLEGTALSIAEVAMQTGFPTPSSFCRACVAAWGKSPSELRKRAEVETVAATKSSKK